MALFAVTIIGQDRPGIVAAVSRVLVDQGCNLEDSEMAILRRQFSMMLIVAGPDVARPSLEQALVDGTEGLDLMVTVRPIESAASADDRPVGSLWTVSMHGADRPGIVAAITAVLADLDTNIVGMETRLVGDPDESLYVMSLDVEVPPGVSANALQARLSQEADQLGIACSLHRTDADIL